MKPILRGWRRLVPAMAGAVLAAASMSVTAPAHAAQPPRAQVAGVQLAYAAPQVVPSRGRVVWRWTLTNTQAHAVSNVVLTHTFTPAVAVTLVSAPCTAGAGTVRCPWASLGAGQAVQGVIETVLPANTPLRVSGQATWVEPGTPPPPVGGPGLRLVYAVPEVVPSRGRVVWRWTLTNAQAHAVSSVVLTHTFTPAVAVTLVSAPCTAGAGTVRCPWASLGAGQAVQGVIETVLPANTPLRVSGQATWVEPTIRSAKSSAGGTSGIAGTSAGVGASTAASMSTAPRAAA